MTPDFRFPVSTQTVSAQVQVEPAPAFGISSEVQSALKNGSYAVIIVFAFIYWFNRKGIADFTAKHTAMMDSLTESNKTNTDNTEKLVHSVEKVTRTNIILAKILAKNFNINLDELDQD